MKEQIECCSTTTSLQAPGGTAYDLDAFGDITGSLPGLHELDGEARDEIMNEITSILGDLVVDTINYRLSQQAPCAWYMDETSEIYVCLNHADCINAAEAFGLADADLDEWINSSIGPVSDAWDEIEKLVNERRKNG